MKDTLQNVLFHFSLGCLISKEDNLFSVYQVLIVTIVNNIHISIHPFKKFVSNNRRHFLFSERFYFLLGRNVIANMENSFCDIGDSGDASSEFGTWTKLIGIIAIILPSLGGFGILTTICWLVYECIRQKYVVSFNINTTQPSYESVILWLKKYGPLDQMQHLTLISKVYILQLSFVSYF